ncbi:urease accessory protein UreE [Paenibacillus solani]|uniref:Urease accessory protein UreE n=1 Tax=Paenibacillus solani TaxID=1705565 RepID=A0A0M1N319_9BACL|nr:urease accessory protein UreE [Paenibacillus solani]KOP65439.1 urease accessory protein UreE [Bacillus sp. FJAT-18019]KOR76582.1 urease accessory protein UreE [Paenibacillus solani]
MIITKIAGHLDNFSSSDKAIDWLELEWEELNKRILRKQTENGRDVSISLENGSHLHYGDVLYEDEDTLIAIRTKLEKVYVIKPKTMREMGKAAFEIGNRHTPCIIEDDEILVRYDHTLEKLMDEVGVTYEQSERRFKEPFKYKGHQH